MVSLHTERHRSLNQALSSMNESKRRVSAKAAYLIGLCIARLNEALPCAVKREYRLLLEGLDRHESHVWTRAGLADRVGVSRVILAGLHICFNEMRRHEPHRVAETLELASPVMQVVARLHSDQAWRKVDGGLTVM